MPETGNHKIIETPLAKMWFDETGILCSVSKKLPRTDIDPRLYKDHIAVLTKLAGDKKLCYLLDATYTAPITKKNRDYLLSELPKVIKAMAAISNSMLGTMVANIFLLLKQQPYPSKLFTNEKAAKEWLIKFL